MAKQEFITAKQFSSDFVEDYGIVQSEVEESLLAKWASDVMCDVNIPECMKDYVSLLPINNYKVQLPENMEIICEVAYKEEREKNDCKVMGYQISQWKQNTCEDGCELEINLVCPACHETSCKCDNAGVTVDIDYLWADARPELYHKHYSNYIGVSRFGYGNSAMTDKFRLMNPTNSPWRHIKHLPECANINCKQQTADYSIEGCVMDVSIKTGWVLVSYLGTEITEEGERKIDISNKDLHRAIMYYLQYKYFNREFQQKRETSSKQLSAEGFELHEEFLSRYLSCKIVPDANELMTYFGSTKFAKICRALGNVYDGKCGVPNMPKNNPFRNR